MRWHGQAVELAVHHFERDAAMAAGVVVFGQAKLDFVAAGEKEQRIVSATDQHRARLSLLENIFRESAARVCRATSTEPTVFFEMTMER